MVPHGKIIACEIGVKYGHIDDIVSQRLHNENETNYYVWICFCIVRISLIFSQYKNKKA